MRALLVNQERKISLNSIIKPKITKPDDILIRVNYSPINPSDLGFSQNVYGKFGHKKYPIGLGFEGSGIIEESAWSDYTIANKSEYLILPEYFTDMKKAAYLMINPLTALSFIDILQRHNSSSVIHTAGASALGRMFTKICVKNGIQIINTVRKDKHIDELNSINSTFTLNSTKDNFKQLLNEAKSKLKPKIAFECIGGEMTGTILNALEEEGILYHYGNLSLRSCSNISTADLIFLNKQIRGFWVFKYLNDYKDNKVKENFFENLNSDLFDTNIQGVFTPDQFEDAFRLYRSEMSRGKVLFDFNH